MEDNIFTERNLIVFLTIILAIIVLFRIFSVTIQSPIPNKETIDK